MLTGSMREFLVAFAGALLASASLAQVEARSASREEAGLAPAQTEVASPMLLEISLAGDGAKKPHVIDLQPDRTRLVRDTAAYVCQGVTVKSVGLQKRPGKRGRLELVVLPAIATENYRDKLDIQVLLLNGEKEVKAWKDRIVVGLSAGDVIGGGAFALASPDREENLEIKFAFDSEQQLQETLGGSEAKMRLVVGIVE